MESVVRGACARLSEWMISGIKKDSQPVWFSDIEILIGYVSGEGDSFDGVREKLEQINNHIELHSKMLDDTRAWLSEIDEKIDSIRKDINTFKNKKKSRKQKKAIRFRDKVFALIFPPKNKP